MMLIFGWNVRVASSVHIIFVAPLFNFFEEMLVAGSVCNKRQTQEMNDRSAVRYKRLLVLGFTL